MDSIRHVHTQRMEIKPTKNERGRPLSVLRLPEINLLHRFGLPEIDLTRKPTRVEPEYARARFSNYLVGEASPTSSIHLNEIHVHVGLGRKEYK